MFTRFSVRLNTLIRSVFEGSKPDPAEEIAVLRTQVDQLRSEHFNSMRSIQEWADSLNTPGALDITLAKIQNSTLDSSTIGATTPAAGAFTTVSATGKFSTTVTGEGFNHTPTTNTAAAYARWTNLGSDTYFGIDNSTGGTFARGNYEMVISAGSGMTIMSTAAIRIRAGAAQSLTLGAGGVDGHVTVSAAGDVSTTGSTTLGNAQADTLNVGNGDIVKDASGNTGLGVSPSYKLDVKFSAATGSLVRKMQFSDATFATMALEVSQTEVQWISNVLMGWRAGAAGASLLNLTTDGRFYGSAIHNNAGAVTGTTNQYVASGTYTPTLTNVVNIAASTAYLCQWIRVGNVVIVSGKVDIDTTAGAVLAQLGMSLPIASNFANARDCGGTFMHYGNEGKGGGIAADLTNDRADFQGLWTSAANLTFTFTFMYLIL